MSTTNLTQAIRRAASRTHLIDCPHESQCPGPSTAELHRAAATLNAALPDLLADTHQQLTQITASLAAGNEQESDLDATATEPEQLLRAWFHWWRTERNVPATLPDGLHVSTAAYLAARAVQSGHKIYGPQDV